MCHREKYSRLRSRGDGDMLVFYIGWSQMIPSDKVVSNQREKYMRKLACGY